MVSPAFPAIIGLFYPFAPPGGMPGPVFPATGREMALLVMTALRDPVFIPVFAYRSGIIPGSGGHGVRWGIVAGDIIGGIVAFLRAR